MFPRWLKEALSGHGISLDLTKKYFGDNAKMSVVDWYSSDIFYQSINADTTGIGYIFKTSYYPPTLERVLEMLLGRIFDIEIESVTAENIKLLNNYRNFHHEIYIVKAYFELRKFSLWDESSKMALLFFVLCLLNFFDYENCLHSEVVRAVNIQTFSLATLFEIAVDYSPKHENVTRPDRTFCKGITKFFNITGGGIYPYNSIRRDLDGITFILASRDALQDALRNLPLDSEAITTALLFQYDKMRRKF